MSIGFDGIARPDHRTLQSGEELQDLVTDYMTTVQFGISYLQGLGKERGRKTQN